MSPALDYSESSRIQQVRKVQRLAKYLESQGMIVIASILYFNNSLSEWNTKNFEEYLEIYLKVSIDKLVERDSKGLYSKAIKGEIPDVVGIDINWDEPKNPDILIENDSFYDVAEEVTKILNQINIEVK